MGNRYGVEFTVPGKAQTKGSWRAIARPGGGFFFKPDNEHEASWRERVAWCARAAEIPKIEGEPIHLEVVIQIARPKSHMTQSGIVRPAARLYPTVKPDLDKLLRSILDALTGVAYIDDSQVTMIGATKIYSLIEQTTIRITKCHK